MSRKPGKIKEFNDNEKKDGKEISLTPFNKKEKLFDYMTSEEIKDLLRSKILK